MKGVSQLDERLVVDLLVAPEMPLQLDVDAVAAEDPDEAVDEAADAELMSCQRRAADERDEAADVSVEIVEASARLRLLARASSFELMSLQRFWYPC